MNYFFKKQWLQLFVSLFFCFQVQAAETHQIHFELNGLSETEVFLAYQYGPKVLVEDTLVLDKKGKVTVENAQDLPGGIYMLIVPKQKHFEFLIAGTEPNMTIKTDVAHFIENMEVKGSLENKLFNEFQRFNLEQQKTIRPLRKQLKALAADNDSIPLLKAAIKQVEEKINDYRNELVAANPETFLAKIFTTMPMPIAPEAPKNEQAEAIDSLFELKYIKAHYWDNVDMSDARFVRTPLLHSKVQQYMENLTFQIPDSVISSAKVVLKEAAADSMVFKYTLTQLFQTYDQTNIIGMDKVYVFLAQKYYLKGKAPWMNDKQLKKIREKSARLKHNLIGKKAPKMALSNTNGELIDVHELDAENIVIVFWSYDCGHCKVEMPKIYNVYKEYKGKDVVFYSVCNGTDKAKWKAYLNKHKYNDWINVIGGEKDNFRFLYDVSTTPKTYILDKDKKIVTKNITVNQLERYLKMMSDKAE